MSNLDEFVAERSPAWTELEQLLATAGSSPERLGADAVRRLGASYRAVAADLALARRRFPTDPLVRRLEQLVQRARVAVYHTAPKTETFRSFVSRGYWQRIRERPGLLVCAAAFLFVPMFLSGYWAWRDPGPAGGLVPSAFQSVTEPRSHGADLHESADTRTGFAASIFTNNIKVSMLAFAGGMLFGLPTLYLLIQNGVLAGVIAGLAIGAGNGRVFFELVLPHGVLELSCIVVSAAAGLRVGLAIIDPGTRERAVALREEARAAIEILLGTAAWLVVAGLVEGFLTPTGQGLTVVLVVGFGLGTLFWVLVFWRGAPARTAKAALAP